MSPSGALIMGVFAALWWVVGVRAAGYGSFPLYLIPVVITSGIVVAALRRRTPDHPVQASEERRRDRVIWIASAAEGVAIFVAVNVLGYTGRLAFTAPVVAIIVGLHFVQLARGLPATRYNVTAGLLVALGAVGVALPDATQRLLVVCIGASSILWLTSAWVLSRSTP
jgi:hypothetical protein